MGRLLRAGCVVASLMVGCDAAAPAEDDAGLARDAGGDAFARVDAEARDAFAADASIDAGELDAHADDDAFVADDAFSCVDVDGDGWTSCDGDCCDEGECLEPALVNPGAFEVLGNGVDDDCDPATSDDVPPEPCVTDVSFSDTSAMSLLAAMDLCRTTTASARTWGVIEATLGLASGAGAPDDVQVGVLPSYGANVTPLRGTTMAALSSGTARAPSDPGYVSPQDGTMPGQTGNYSAGTTASLPSGFLAANGGTVPTDATCPSCVGAACTLAYDSVRLHVRLRAPTNAFALSYRLKLYSAEYPEARCSSVGNDAVIVLMHGAAELPADANVAVTPTGLLSVNNALTSVCFPTVGAPPGACAGGTLELVGTGMGGWGTNLRDGAATEWLTGDAPVVPGEIIELEVIIWDGGDARLDSLVLLDAFEWSTEPLTAGLHR